MFILSRLRPVAERMMKRALSPAMAQRVGRFFTDLHREDVPHEVPSETSISTETAIAARFLPDRETVPHEVPSEMSISTETAIAARFLPDRNGVVVDVGANHGEWTKEILARGNRKIARLIAVEPQASLIPALDTLIDKRIELVHSAIGRTAGLATLYWDKAGSELASLTKRRIDHVGIQMSMQEQVSITTLDDLATSRNLDRIDILKLDIEGHELDALAGAWRLFAERRIGYVQFEFGGCNIDTKTYLRDFWHFFNDRGYAVGRIARHAQAPLLVPLTHYSEKLEHFTTTNYGAWPIDRGFQPEGGH
jgi:FkbM family methyltransferase